MACIRYGFGGYANSVLSSNSFSGTRDAKRIMALFARMWNIVLMLSKLTCKYNLPAVLTQRHLKLKLCSALINCALTSQCPLKSTAQCLIKSKFKSLHLELEIVRTLAMHWLFSPNGTHAGVRAR